MMPKLVIFDWDGTLADSITHIVAAIHAATDAMSRPRKSERDVRNIIGLGLTEAIFALFPGENPDFAALFSAHYRDAYLGNGAETVLMPDARFVLSRLQQCGIMLAIATGKSRRGLDRVLRESGLVSTFAFTVTPNEAPSKPAPGMVERLLDGAGVAPEAAVVVGDSAHDMAMAKAAGVRAICVSHGAHDSEVLLRAGADEVIAGLGQLPSLLGLRVSGL